MYIYVCLSKDYSENAVIRNLRHEDSVSMAGLPIHISLMEPVFCNGCSWFGFDVEAETGAINSIFSGASNRWPFEAYGLSRLYWLDLMCKRAIIVALCNNECDIKGLRYQSYFASCECDLDVFARKCDAFEPVGRQCNASEPVMLFELAY